MAKYRKAGPAVTEGSVYRNRLFWEALFSRALRTLGQSAAGALTAAIFTGTGATAFFIIVGVAVLGSVFTSLATPRKIMLSEYEDEQVIDE